jgi:hypothetical protein
VELLPSPMDDPLRVQTLLTHHWLKRESDEETRHKLRAIATISIVSSNPGITRGQRCGPALERGSLEMGAGVRALARGSVSEG